MRVNRDETATATQAPKRILGVGEAMVEFSPAGDDLYRLGFAGDTFNTVWHMSQLLAGRASTGFFTRVGTDGLSSRFVSEMKDDGLDPNVVGRDDARHMGLYLIELTGTERSFQYWRNDSAAKRLADKAELLNIELQNADLIHVSGITLAVLSAEGRSTLLTALSAARENGARISFDPNVRPGLWKTLDEAKASVLQMLELTDIALPSFEDEKMLWGDTSPSGTVKRYRELGVAEVVVKNGADPVVCGQVGDELVISTPRVSGVRDTTGAGDAFNAGYLSARIYGAGQLDAVRAGQCVSSEVLKHLGARAPKDLVRELGQRLIPTVSGRATRS